MYRKLCNKLKNIEISKLKISLGFDGYLDEIISAVDFREDIDNFKKITTISNLGNRILDAAGKSTNIELVTDQWKLGGNGPILGNSIANIGVHVDYIGALGVPEVHNVFKGLPANFKTTSIENPGHTMALEFSDGKIMFGRLAMKDLTWGKIEEKVNTDELISFFTQPDLIGMVNWTQTPYMKEIWDTLLNNFLPKQKIKNPAPFLFIDLADPQKREHDDIIYMLKQLKSFSKYYRVILGVNEKEACEIAKVQNISYKDNNADDYMALSKELQKNNDLYCCVIHPVKFAVCSINDQSFYQEGPYTPNPLISTGAGDHFNAGFCFGQIAGLTPDESLLVGVANSGYYVRTAKSANIEELIGFIDEWKNR